jgi:hypothetical protein
MAAKRGVPMVYKCMVWWRDSGHAIHPSAAYGLFQEHDNLDAAMRDKVALLLTSMKGAKPDGNFHATVCEYPKGYPPITCRWELFFSLGGDE